MMHLWSQTLWPKAQANQTSFCRCCLGPPILPRLKRMQWLLDCTESLQEEDVQELLKSWCGTLGQAAGPRLKGSRIKTHVSHSFSGFPGAEIHIGGKPAVPKLLRKDVADSHSEKKTTCAQQLLHSLLLVYTDFEGIGVIGIPAPPLRCGRTRQQWPEAAMFPTSA